MSDACDVDVGGGLSLHLARAGVGPPLLLLHGFTDTARAKGWRAEMVWFKSVDERPD